MDCPQMFWDEMGVNSSSMGCTEVTARFNNSGKFNPVPAAHVNKRGTRGALWYFSVSVWLEVQFDWWRGEGGGGDT